VLSDGKELTDILDGDIIKRCELYSKSLKPRSLLHLVAENNSEEALKYFLNSCVGYKTWPVVEVLALGLAAKRTCVRIPKILHVRGSDVNISEATEGQATLSHLDAPLEIGPR
jgi:hypothetical protein